MTDWPTSVLHAGRSAELQRSVLHHRRVAAALRRRHARRLARRAAVLAERSAVLTARAVLLAPGPPAAPAAGAPERGRVATR